MHPRGRLRIAVRANNTGMAMPKLKIAIGPDMVGVIISNTFPARTPAGNVRIPAQRKAIPAAIAPNMSVINATPKRPPARLSISVVALDE